MTDTIERDSTDKSKPSQFPGRGLAVAILVGIWALAVLAWITLIATSNSAADEMGKVVAAISPVVIVAITFYFAGDTGTD